MVTVASDFLSMLNGKWSSEKFQDEMNSSVIPDLIWLRWYVSYVDIVTENTNIAIGEHYSKFFLSWYNIFKVWIIQRSKKKIL
jgi:hypothetical protein